MNRTELVEGFLPLFTNGDLVILALKHEAAIFPEKDVLVVEVHLRYQTLYKMPKSLQRKLKNEAYQSLKPEQQKEIIKKLESFDVETLRSIHDYLSHPSEEARWSLM